MILLAAIPDSKRSNYRRAFILASLIIAISLLHYLTPLHHPALHDIFQRLYYIPVILAAFWFGLKGGLACSILVSIAYVPHIVFQWRDHLTLEMEKYLEIVLYNIVGGITGFLSQRERERAEELEKSAGILEDSFTKLRIQSKKMMAIEEQLRTSEKLSSLGEMAAMLAHEIRNPLGSIRGTAEILKDDYRRGDPKYEFLEIQIKETERLNRVVEEFLRMARQQPVELSDCSLFEELETIVTILSNDAANRGVSLRLLPTTGDVNIRGDGEKLRQAFLNIVLNALQATPPGGCITISITRTAYMFQIRVSDTGQGITTESISKIFEPFFTTKPEGTGLGLAVTKKIIERHGGSLAVESIPAVGTTVVVSLPSDISEQEQTIVI